MRIIIAYRYFWPDTPPYATMLREISKWLVDAGHEVTILTAQPAYKPDVKIGRQPSREIIDGVQVVRLPLLREGKSGLLKAVNGGLFIAQAALRVLFGPRRDLVWTATMPPVLQARALSLVARVRRASFLYHMQDIHPEISIYSHTMKPGRIAGIMGYLDRQTLRGSHHAIVLSTDMKKAVEDRGIDPSIPTVLRNFSIGEVADCPLAEAPKDGEPVRFVFAGNIGRFQNLEALVDAFGQIDGDRVRLELVGDGRLKNQLVERVRKQGIDNVIFKDHMSPEDAYRYMTQCHVGLVSLSPNLYKYAFPSKVLTYMAANLPMLAMVEDDSSLARLLRENEIGVSVAWERSLDEMVNVILLAGELAKSGKAEPARMKDYYHPERAREEWVRLIAELETERKAA